MFRRNDEIFVTKIEVGPFEIENDVPTNSGGGNKRDESFPPKGANVHIEIARIFVTSVTKINGGVEGISKGVWNVSRQTFVGLRRSNPGSFFDETESVSVSGAGGASFGPNGVEVTTVFANGFDGKIFGL